MLLWHPVAQPLPGAFANPAAYGNLVTGVLALLARIALRTGWAGATGFQDPEKGGREPVGPSRRKPVPGGIDWRQPGV